MRRLPGEDRPTSGGPASAKPSALGEAVAVHREAVAVSSPDDPQRPGYLNNLARTLRERARRDDDPDALDEAISLLREAIESARPGHVFRSAMLSHLPRPCWNGNGTAGPTSRSPSSSARRTPSPRPPPGALPGRPAS
ncbi:tetratricopeptide repeat protein [Streptomyces albulus]|nr:tetratricopeptide repeat protein [Streptomyces noursei]